MLTNQINYLTPFCSFRSLFIHIGNTYSLEKKLALKKRDGTTINSWATSLIEKKLESMKSDDGKRKYILSRGRRTAEKTGKEYYDFKIICK